MPIFEYSFEKFRTTLSSSENHVNVYRSEIIAQKVEDFYIFYEISL